LVEHAPLKMVGSIPSGHIEDLKTYNLSSLVALMGGWKETLHTRCCDWLVTSTAFTAKVAAWATAQVEIRAADHSWHYEKNTETECNRNWTKYPISTKRSN